MSDLPDRRGLSQPLRRPPDSQPPPPFAATSLGRPSEFQTGTRSTRGSDCDARRKQEPGIGGRPDPPSRHWETPLSLHRGARQAAALETSEVRARPAPCRGYSLTGVPVQRTRAIPGVISEAGEWGGRTPTFQKEVDPPTSGQEAYERNNIFFET